MDATAIYMLSAASLKLIWSLLNSRAGRTVPKHAELVGEVSEVTLYPLKSMRGIQLDSAECTFRGLKYPKKEVFDRTFVVVDDNSRFVTARAEPKMTTIVCLVEGDQLVVTCQGMHTLTLPITAPVNRSKIATTKIWGEKVEGQDCGDEAANWISECLEKPGCRLLYGRDGLMRRELIDQQESYKQLAKQGDQVTYQDGFPYLLISQASLTDLNKLKGGEAFAMARFRPNLVVSGCEPYDEDNWDELWIGDKVKFTNLKPGVRCILTTIDPSTGKKHPREEPIRTLKKYRLNTPLFGPSPKFGVNLVLDRANGEVVSVGDPVYILRKGTNF